MTLTDRDRSILDFERVWWMLGMPKASAIRQRLGLSPTRYYRRLSALADSTEALAYDPLVVRRLRRARRLRRQARVEGRSYGQGR